MTERVVAGRLVTKVVAATTNTGVSRVTRGVVKTSVSIGGSGARGPRGPGVTPRGEWDSSGMTTYQVDDAVTFNGSWYRCIVDGTVGSPGAYPGRWSLLVASAQTGIAFFAPGVFEADELIMSFPVVGSISLSEAFSRVLPVEKSTGTVIVKMMVGPTEVGILTLAPNADAFTVSLSVSEFSDPDIVDFVAPSTSDATWKGLRVNMVSGA